LPDKIAFVWGGEELKKRR